MAPRAETAVAAASTTPLPEILGAAAEAFRAMAASVPEATVMLLDTAGTVWLAEGRLLSRNGYASGSLAPRPIDAFLPPSRADTLRAHYEAALAGNVEEFDYLAADERTLCAIRLTPLTFGAERPVAVLAVVRDVTREHHMSAELDGERERRVITEALAGVTYWRFDPETGTITLSSRTPLTARARRRASAPLAYYLESMSQADRRPFVEALEAAVAVGESAVEYEYQRSDGSLGRAISRARQHRGGDGRIEVIGASVDITEIRAAAQARGEYEALFSQGFDSSPVGMAVTEPASGRYLRVNDALCRFLGRSREELLALSFVEVSHEDDVATDESGRIAMMLAGGHIFEFEKRYRRPDGTVVWGSLHVVPVRNADGEVTAFFSQVMDLTARKERECELVREAEDRRALDRVREALADDRLVLFAQPIIDVATGREVQHELLVRMVAEDGTIVGPADFLPLAERHGLIGEIDRWVIRHGIALAASGMPVEINLSAASVGDPATLRAIRDALGGSGADPACVVFEVTETALMADVELGRRFALALRELGCRFALDDFGTGYGTFTYLKHLPIDVLKIDIEFVRELDRSADDERMVRAIVAMARDFGKQTIAEGVENAETLERLRELGVDHAQGYHIGRPGPLALPEPPAADPAGTAAAVLRDPGRLRALERSGLLDPAPAPELDRLTRLACRQLDVPVSLVSLVQTDGQVFKSATGLELAGTPLTHSFCQHVVAHGAPLVVSDTRQDARVRGNLAIDELDVVAYAGVPLRTDDGHVLGAFCAIDTAARRWSAEDVALLRDLAARTMATVTAGSDR